MQVCGTQPNKSRLSPENHIVDRAPNGESFLEALILASTNPQYYKSLFIDLPVQYMKTTSSEHIVYCFDIQKNLCTQHVLSL